MDAAGFMLMSRPVWVMSLDSSHQGHREAITKRIVAGRHLRGDRPDAHRPNRFEQADYRLVSTETVPTAVETGLRSMKRIDVNGRRTLGRGDLDVPARDEASGKDVSEVQVRPHISEGMTRVGVEASLSGSRLGEPSGK